MNAIFIAAIAASVPLLPWIRRFYQSIVALCCLLNTKITGTSDCTFRSFIPCVTPSTKSKCLVLLYHTSNNYNSIYGFVKTFFFHIWVQNPWTFHRMMCDGTSLSKSCLAPLYNLLFPHSILQPLLQNESFAFGKLLCHKLILLLIVAIHNIKFD
jgi:hypothetical protein